MMQREIIYDTLEAFLSGLKDHAIQKISFSETSEKRAVQVQPGALHVVHVDQVELIAYKKSVIYKCAQKNIDRDALYDRLTAEGFDVTRRSRNIT
jgi:hypothetical protein